MVYIDYKYLRITAKIVRVIYLHLYRDDAITSRNRLHGIKCDIGITILSSHSQFLCQWVIPCIGLTHIGNRGTSEKRERNRNIAPRPNTISMIDSKRIGTDNTITTTNFAFERISQQL